MKIAILSENIDIHQPFWAHLDNHAELLLCPPREEDITQMLHVQNIDVVIGFDSDLNLIKSTIANFPMINYALVSSCSAKDFHEMTEGYGFFMQLPTALSKEHAKTFMERFAAITSGSRSRVREGSLS